MTDTGPNAGKTNFAQTLVADAVATSKWFQARHIALGIVIGIVIRQLVLWFLHF